MMGGDLSARPFCTASRRLWSTGTPANRPRLQAGMIEPFGDPDAVPMLDT
jgi:hypothetical protein